MQNDNMECLTRGSEKFKVYIASGKAGSRYSHSARRTLPLPAQCCSVLRRSGSRAQGERWQDGQWLLQASSSSRHRVPFPPQGPRVAATNHLSYFMSLNQFSESQGSDWLAGSYAHPWRRGEVRVSAPGNHQAESGATVSSVTMGPRPEDMEWAL